MKTVLTVVLNYFPGYRSGGVARTILNTTEWLGNDFRFLVLTRDRDLGSDVPYADIDRHGWNRLGRSQVRYLAPQDLSLARLAALIKATPHDVLHLNSYFDPVFTIRLLLLWRLGRIAPGAVLVSPRGEFGEGSLRLKYPKKKVYLETARLLRLYDGVSWHASSEYEADEMAAVMRIPKDAIRIAIDLPTRHEGEPAGTPAPACAEAPLKVVFLSRVSREKNLDGALRMLRGVKSPVAFDMVGPQEDARYWSECEALMRTLPPHVHARHLGPVPPDQVLRTLAGYDLLFLPSLGENYGHVIAESIAAGTRVLISRLTPWRDLARDGLGWDLDLDAPEHFVEVIESVAKESPAQRAKARETTRAGAAARLSDPVALEQNRRLFASLSNP